MAQGNILGQDKKESVIVCPTEPTGLNRRKIWIQKGKNLIDISYTEEATTFDTSTGLVTDINATAYSCAENYIEVMPNTMYTISANKSLSSVSLYEYTGEKIYTQKRQAFNKNGINITTSATTKYLRWSLNIDDINTPTVEKIHSLELQLEQGAERTDYEPYINNKVYIKNDNNTYEKFIEKEENIIVKWKEPATGFKYRKIGTTVEMNIMYAINKTINNGEWLTLHTLLTKYKPTTVVGFPVLLRNVNDSNYLTGLGHILEDGTVRISQRTGSSVTVNQVNFTIMYSTVQS